jgi:hypothetical protein
MANSDELLERMLSQFIETSNKRFNEQDKKLDLLMDLLKNVSVLQEKQGQNSENIKKVEGSVSILGDLLDKKIALVETKIDKIELERVKNVDRIHERIDAINKDFDAYDKEHEVTTKVTNTSIQDLIKDTNEKLKTLKDDYNSRVSFFKGIFAAFAIFSSGAQYFLYKYFSDIESHMSDTKVSLQKMDNRFAENERQMELIQTNVRALKQVSLPK